MAKPLTGSVYPVKGGYGIRWWENGRREHECPDPPFRNKTEARDYFDEHVKPRLRHHAPSAAITFDDFCDVFLARHDGAASTVRTLRDRLRPARDRFGDWRLRELEGASNDVARWRAELPDRARYRHTAALRQCLAAAVRWRFITRNPAVDAGRNPKPRSREIDPLDPGELDRILAELAAPDLQLVTFAAETGLRPEEWCALERSDFDRRGRRVYVQRKFAKGRPADYPKTSRRGVPLSARAYDALADVPPRFDTRLIFPAVHGGHISLDNWRSRVWYPALEGAGVRRRGPYALRHTFATEALAAGISTFELARVMGTSLEMIDLHYGHLARDSEESIRARLDARAARMGDEWATGDAQ